MIKGSKHTEESKKKMREAYARNLEANIKSWMFKNLDTDEILSIGEASEKYNIPYLSIKEYLDTCGYKDAGGYNWDYYFDDDSEWIDNNGNVMTYREMIEEGKRLREFAKQHGWY